MKRAGLGITAIAACGGLVALALNRMTPPASTYASYGLLTLVPWTAAAAAFAASKRIEGPLSKPWRYVGAACTSWGIGTALWALRIELHLDPFPQQFMHIPYIAAFPLFVLAVFGVSHDEPEHSPMRRMIDGALIATSIFLVSWVFVIDALWHHSHLSVIGRTIALAYPVGDVFALALVAFVSMRINESCRGRLLLFGTGIVSFAIADTGFAYLQLTRGYRNGDPIDAAYAAGFGVIALAGFFALGDRGEKHGFDASPLRVNLPYYVAGIAFPVIIGVRVVRGRLDAVLFVGLLALVVLVVVRQYRVLTENQRRVIGELERVDDLRTGILRAVSHELRTPLTFLKGTTEFLAEESENISPEKRAELVGRMGLSVDRLEELFGGLLDLERLTRGALEIRREHVGVRNMILAVAEAVDLNEHRLRVSVDEELDAFVDRGRVERIVENLILNGVRHTPAGSEIVVSAEHRDDGTLLAVDDNGPGVPAGQREYVFQPFAQLQEQQRGAGLGLSLVADYAGLHGGRAWIDDSPSGGARFCVYLPDH